jgi:hypothetical protein
MDQYKPTFVCSAKKLPTWQYVVCAEYISIHQTGMVGSGCFGGKFGEQVDQKKSLFFTKIESIEQFTFERKAKSTLHQRQHAGHTGDQMDKRPDGCYV